MLSRFLSWFFGWQPKTTFTIDGVGLAKIYVFANGREATLDEMLMVIQSPRFRIHGGGEGSRFESATEQWDAKAGEDEAAVLQRLAHETAAKHPGMAVVAFDWPDTNPSIIAVIVTDNVLKTPLFFRTRGLFALPPS